MKSHITSCILFFFLIGLHPQFIHGQEREKNGFILLNADDTLSIEKYERDDNLVKGKVFFKQQVPVVYEASLTEKAGIDRMTVQVLEPGTPEGAPPIQEGSLEFNNGKVYTSSKTPNSTSRDTIVTTASLAYHPNLPMVSLLEQIVINARKQSRDSVTVPLFLLSSQGKTIDVNLNFSKKDSVFIGLGNMKVALKIDEKGKVLGGYTSNGQTIKRLDNIPEAAFKSTPPDYSAPEGAPYTAEEVEIQTKAGHLLVGTLTLPKEKENLIPVVVTISGSSPQDRDHNTPFGGPYKLFRQLADSLGKRGIAVLRMDDRGVGKSTGDFESANSRERANDIREGIQYVKSRPEIDKNKVMLVGLSEGGLIAPMIAETNSDLKGIVLMAGTASTGKEIMKYQIEERLSQRDTISSEEKEALLKDQITEIENEAKRNDWLRFYLEYDPVETARKVKEVPVLILHGTNDKNVPPADAKKLAAAFKSAGNNNVTVQIFEGYNHVFLKDPNGHPNNYNNLESYEVPEEIIGAVVEWVEKISDSSN